MTSISNKTHIGYEDIEWGDVTDTFTRKTTTGGAITLHKVPTYTGSSLVGYTSSIEIADIKTKSPWVDVRAYGAKGDGVTDDTAAIQVAIDTAKTNHIDILVPYGTYLISSGLVLDGTGAGAYFRGKIKSTSGRTIFKTNTNISIMKITTPWIIEGITLKGYASGGAWYGTGVLLDNATNVVFKECEFETLDIGIDTLVATPSYWIHLRDCVWNGMTSYGIKLRTASNVWQMYDCDFYNGLMAGTAIETEYGSGIIMSGGSIQTFPTGINIIGSQVPVIRGVFFENNDNDILIDQYGTYDARNVSIQDCSTRYKAATSVFIYARNTMGLTLINNWASNTGAGMLDADTTVKGIVLLNNKNYESGTPIFKGSVPDGSIVQWSDFHNANLTPVNRFSNEIVWIDEATPSVADGNLFQTANVVPTAVTDFLNGINGQVIRILVKDAFTTFDFTGTNLKGNGGIDWSPQSGDWLDAVYDSDDGCWYCSCHGTNAGTDIITFAENDATPSVLGTKLCKTFSEELATNGGFEIGNPPTGWTAVFTPETFERSNVQVHSGIYSAHIVDSTPSYGGFYQDYAFVNGEDYTISYRYYVVSGELAIETNMGNIEISVTSGSWVYGTTSFTAAGEDKIRFINRSNVNPAEFYVDVVSIIQTSHAGVTITNLDDGIEGQEIKVLMQNAYTVIDFTDTNLIGNGGIDWNPASGDWMDCVFNGTNWYCECHGFNLSSSQIIPKFLDDSTTILHQWGGNKYWSTQGNGPDALGLVYNI